MYNPSAHLSRLRNWISMAGMVLAGSALFAFVLLFAIDFFASQSNPYIGILTYVVAPMFLALGLFLIVLGYVLVTRRIRKGLPARSHKMVLRMDLSYKRDRMMLAGFVGGSFLFLFLTALGSYQTYHLTETNEFCGKTCHTSMDPQFVAYQHSPHAEIGCVECHVGSGAGNYMRTKLNGVKQLYHTVLGDFPRPIVIENPHLRPRSETCVACHWSKRDVGNVPRTYRHFLADEANTPFTVEMVLKVGGGDPVNGRVRGIHSHMDSSKKIEFIATDDQRQNIPWVRVTDQDGKQTVYATEEFKDDPAKHEMFSMDCIDCHNRPAHRFTAPNTAVDKAMANGKIDPAIPWVKANVVKALAAPYATKQEAEKGIAASLKSAYEGDSRVDAVIAQAQQIYNVNFAPEMKADWRVHPDMSGHKDTNGCFRCHDGMHFAQDGETTIGGSDCKSCHLIVAQGSGKELETLYPEGAEFFHIDSEYSDLSCAECHNGQMQEDEEDAEMDEPADGTDEETSSDEGDTAPAETEDAAPQE